LITFHSASSTDAGRVRTVNQDVALADERLVAVADGMGGHAAGDVAARIAIDSLERAVTPADGPDTLIDAAIVANRAVYDEALAHSEMRGMGTTLTAAALVDMGGTTRICLINVGDSRAYLLEGGQFTRLTDDHSLVEQLVRQGELTAEEAAVHPHRHILTRALGIDLELEVDSWILEPRDGMRLLLCSDGLTNECTEEEIAVVLRDLSRPEDAATNLVERALAHGGNDNITVVVVDVDLGSAGQPLSTVDEDPLVDDLPHTVRRQPGVVRAEEATAPEPVARRTRASAPAASRRRERIVTARVVLFVIVLAALLGGIAGITIWFDRATYFVGIDRGNVAIFEGRPGGMLWFHPTLVTRTTTPSSAVLDANLPLLRAGILESSYQSAATTANNLANERSLLGLGLPSTTTTTTTTTPKPSGTPTGVTGTH
jgi:serine/threonine protein phosphatase PrpC